MDERDGGLVNLLREHSDASDEVLEAVGGWYSAYKDEEDRGY